jgi:hypothetical protein
MFPVGLFENLAASGDALVDWFQDHDTKCVSLASFPSTVPKSHGLDRAEARSAPCHAIKTDQCLLRFFILAAVAAARALGMLPAAVLPERAGASLRRAATDPTF